VFLHEYVESATGEPQTRIDGVDRQGQCLGDRRAAQPFELTKRKHLALFDGQALQERGHEIVGLSMRHLLLRIQTRPRRFAATFALGPAMTLAPVVQRHTSRDAVEPARQSASPLEGRQAIANDQKYGMNEVFEVLVVHTESSEGTPNEPRVGAIHPLEIERRLRRRADGGKRHDG